MTEPITILPEASEEASQAHEWYEAREAGPGQRFPEDLSDCIHRIADNPQR